MSIDVTVKKEGGNWVCDPETLTVTTKNKKTKPARLEFNKFCRRCRCHRSHRETK